MDVELLELARRVAVRHARVYGRGDVDDLVAQAWLALVEEYPRLAARFGEPVDRVLVGRMVKLRLVDCVRTQRGRHRRKAHDRAVSLDVLRDVGFDVPAADDAIVDGEVDGPVGVAGVVDEVVGCQPAWLREQTRLICEWIVAGRTQAEIADELGVSVSRVSQLVAQIGERVRELHEIGSPLRIAI